MPDSFVVGQTEHFKVEVALQGDKAMVRPIGQINEDVNLGQLHKTLSSIQSVKSVVFDLREITKINSCGIREWLLFIERLQGSHAIEFSMVNELFISQASLVPSLLGTKGTQVISFEAPYHCPKCDKSVTRVLRSADLKFDGRAFVAPASVCDTCKGPLQFDALEEEFFHFLKHAKK